MKLWRNRRWLRGALSEVGCGFLTVLFITIPLWVFTVATRGPRFALGIMALLLVVVIGMAVISRLLKRK